VPRAARGARHTHRIFLPREIGASKKGIGDRQIAYDPKPVLSVLNWATIGGAGEGGVLLDGNPAKTSRCRAKSGHDVHGCPTIGNQRIVGVSDQVHPDLHAALAHETGHRLSRVRQLRWSDVL